MSTVEGLGVRSCPACGAEVPVEEGVRTWCDRCGWNLGDEGVRSEESFLARQYVRMGKAYGDKVLQALKGTPAQDLRPRWTIRKGVAFLLAMSVHLLTAGLFVAGVYIIAWGFPELPPMLPGFLACGVALLLRPRLGKLPAKGIVGQEEFPALYALANEIARKLGGRPINRIIVDENFNAAYGVVGWRRVPVLWIGLPLWMVLRPQERLALLGHEVAHGVNGDGTRSLAVVSALDALDEWIGLLRAPLSHASTWHELIAAYLIWPLSIPFAMLESILAHLLWLNKQQAEFFADYLGSTISGTAAAVSLLRRMECGAYLHEVLLRNAYSNFQSGAYILSLFRQRVANLPEREWQRLARLAQREGARLDASHPPTGHRIEFLLSHVIAEPSMVADPAAMSAIDAELAKLHERLGCRLIARYARD
jgi:Zn-dependent protease with chaperone function